MALNGSRAMIGGMRQAGERPGRKALLVGVPGRQAARHQDEGDDEVFRNELGALLSQGIAGDFSGRIQEDALDPRWKPVGSRINSLFAAFDETAGCAGWEEFFHRVPIPMAVGGPSGRLDDANEAFVALFTLPKAEILSSWPGIPGVDLIPGDRGEELDLAGANGARQRFVQIRVPAGGPGGGELILLSDVTPVRTPQAQEEAEAAERTSLSRFRETMIAGNPVPLLVLDPNLRVIEASEAFSRVSGIARQDIPGRFLPDLGFSLRGGLSPEDALRFHRHVVGECSMDLPSGSHIFETYAIPMPAESGSGVLILLYDQTEQVRRQEHLEEEIRKLREELVSRPDSRTTAKPPQEQIAPVPSPVVPVAKAPAPDPVPQSRKQAASGSKREQIFDVVEFELGGEQYAMDIQCAREIVEMMPVTPIPRAPRYLCGVMNLRGEITNIININQVLGIPEEKAQEGRKIIVLSQEASEGDNMGIIVDDVHTVLQVRESEVEHLDEGIARESTRIKGIIKIHGRGAGEGREGRQGTDLVIWIDIRAIIRELSGKQQSPA
jgi:purine-binding chemotaxis protein CheW